MFEIKIDDREFKKLGREFPGNIKRALNSVLKSEAAELRAGLSAYASGATGGIAPVTPLLRRRSLSYGQLLGKVVAYEADQEKLSAQIGIIEHGRRPVRPGLAVMAKRQAKGYPIPITRAAQRTIAKRLARKFSKITGRGQWGSHAGILSWVPRLGKHYAQARPIVGQYYMRVQAKSIARIKRNFAIKVAGGRY